ncbi:MAG: hypothetical protein KAI71_02635 [Candidatus Pacebacteria bacterium]|nr:hypothetical protein [Candidatus Paceibacterota bacterium]
MNQAQIPPEFWYQSLQALGEGPKILASILMETTKQLLSSYWQCILFLILFTALIKILAGKIGSLIYNLIYFGILFVIIAISGFEILFNPYFDILYLLFRPVSFFLTGCILDKLKPRHGIY